MFHVKNLSILLIFILTQFDHLQSIPFRFRIVTWNVRSSEPNCTAIEQLAFTSITKDFKPEIIVFGFQDATRKRFGENAFHRTLTDCLEANNYLVMTSDYVGSNMIKPIWLYVYISEEASKSERVQIFTFNDERTWKVYQDKVFENYIGYKGIIATRFRIDDKINLAFANMHLPAGEGQSEARCKLWSKFVEIYEANNFDDYYMFVFGDQNWRTRDSLTIEAILQAIQNNQYQTILEHDELKQMLQNEGSSQCLSTFFEAPIEFPPTYKYVLNSDEYQTEKNNEERRPSYTDRILVSKVPTDLTILEYSALNDIKLSDHRPVYADIILNKQSDDSQTSDKDRNIPRRRKSQIIQSSKTDLFFMIGFILLIKIIIIVLVVLFVYYFIIKVRKVRGDIS